jgi:hypothetical protein
MPQYSCATQHHARPPCSRVVSRVRPAAYQRWTLARKALVRWRVADLLVQLGRVAVVDDVRIGGRPPYYCMQLASLRLRSRCGLAKELCVAGGALPTLRSPRMLEQRAGFAQGRQSPDLAIGESARTSVLSTLRWNAQGPAESTCSIAERDARWMVFYTHRISDPTDRR